MVPRPRRLSRPNTHSEGCAGPLETVETDRFFGGLRTDWESLESSRFNSNPGSSRTGFRLRRANEIPLAWGSTTHPSPLYRTVFGLSSDHSVPINFTIITTHRLQLAGRPAACPTPTHVLTPVCEFIFGASPRTATAAVIQHNSRVAGRFFEEHVSRSFLFCFASRAMVLRGKHNR